MIVVDTHALMWWLMGSERLSRAAEKSLKAASAEMPALVSTISLMEIATAVRRRRISLLGSLDVWVDKITRLPEIRFEPVTPEIAVTAGGLAGELHADPADRIIAATALVFGVPLVTADQRLRSWSGLKTIW